MQVVCGEHFADFFFNLINFFCGGGGLVKKCQAVISVKPNSADLSRAKLFIDYFSWTCELFKNAKKDLACAIRDCLGVSLIGVSRPFVSDTSPKCIDREGLERRRIGTREEIDQELWRTL